MESEKKFNFDWSKYLPIIISVFVILMIGLSFIGNYFQVTHYEGEIEVTNDVSLITLLFTHSAGYSAQIYFILLYMVLPILASVLLYFSSINNNFSVASTLIFIVIAVASIVTKDVYHDAIKYYYRVVENVKYSFEIGDITFSYTLPIICYFVSFGASLFISSKDATFTSRDITEMGVLIAAAVGLNFIKLFPMPTGGSVNFQMLPLFLLALRRGPLKGFVAGGIIYGLITCLTDGYGFACFPFDYLVGFGSIAIFGFFSKLIFSMPKDTIFGELLLFGVGTLSTFIRFVGGTVSSMVVYNYDFIAAATYNAPYIFISGGISLVVLIALFRPITRINERYPVENIA